MTLSRAYRLFRTMGLRHLFVTTEPHPTVVGAITRKDIIEVCAVAAHSTASRVLGMCLQSELICSGRGLSATGARGARTGGEGTRHRRDQPQPSVLLARDGGTLTLTLTLTKEARAAYESV